MESVAPSSSGAALARCARRANGWSDGGVQWLEHINLVVGDRNLVESFYFQGLGLTRDPAKAYGQSRLPTAPVLFMFMPLEKAGSDETS